MTTKQFLARLKLYADCGFIKHETAKNIVKELEENNSLEFFVKETQIFCLQIGDVWLSHDSLKIVGNYYGFGRAYKALKSYAKANDLKLGKELKNFDINKLICGHSFQGQLHKKGYAVGDATDCCFQIDSIDVKEKN